MRRNLQGKHIWLVGASTGIGRELARELASRGAVLTVSARSADKLEELAAEIPSPVSVVPLDVSDAAAVEKAARELPDYDGVVFLAAAYNPDKGKSRTPPELVEKVISVNLCGAIHLTQAVMDRLAGRPDGFLALYGSVAGYRGLPHGQPYCATKAGVISYAESMRVELRGKVDVKVINSGFVDTRLTRQNEFKMPMLMEPQEAARRIANGLERGGFEICFPKRFAYLVKLLRLMPYPCFLRLARRFN